MRIFHIDRQNSWTGQINRVFQVSKRLRDRGHEVTIVAQPKSQLAVRAREAELDVAPLRMRGWRFNFAIPQLTGLLRDKKVDILHCHGPRDHLLSVLAGRLAPVPHVLRTKHNHTRLKSGYWSRLLYERCSKIVTISDFIRDELIQDGIDPSHVETIHTSVDAASFHPRSKSKALLDELQISESEIILGCISSLHLRKGIEDLLRAFKIVQDALPDKKIKCLLVGRRWKRWRSIVAELGLGDQVVFTGFRRDVQDLLALLDIYVLPSWDEGLGTSILEAMAMGRPVVTSNVGGITEAVTRETGVTVPPRQPEMLASEIIALLGDPDRRETLGTAARQRVEQLFSLETLVDRMENLYKRLMIQGAQSTNGRT